ncbi:hypothetical protein BGZ82_002204 [Podila clonocystis]|nr:hypothetical protein BGZ82_002204 [Podila clonocystis]
MVLRPTVKPHLLTDFEFETMWDPRMDTLRLGVLLPFNSKAPDREASLVRKGLSVGGVIGDIRSDLTRYEALMTSSVQIPQCSYASGHTILSDVRAYPYFFRTIPTNIVVIDSILALLRAAGWKRISLIYDIETLGWAGREYFSARAAKMGIFILAYEPLRTAGVPYDASYDFVKTRIRSTQSRIQVLIATGTLQKDMLHQMKVSGFMKKDYAWVTMNNIVETLEQDTDVAGYDGLILIDIGYELPGYEPYEKFLKRWHIRNAEKQGTSRSEMIRRVIAGEGTGSIRVPHHFINSPYNGPSGAITLDVNGDRKDGVYNAISMQDGRGVIFARISSGDYHSIRQPPFKPDCKTWPTDAPPWAIKNPKWTNATGIIYGTFCIVGILATLASAVMVIWFRDNIVIKASSPTFCICELLGILLIYTWCILHVGIPTTGTCIATSILLPIGTTLLAGSLTVKNYRIYRIFNSVTMANQAFQTHHLLRFVLLVVILAAAPMIAEVIVDKPKPATINIQSYQWIQCYGLSSEDWWVVAAGSVPLLLIIFGVFLAFKTRNVTYLWNEASQISLVLYNVFFFTLVITISLFFPSEIYMATFYISTIGIYFTASLALVVLFAPKVYNLWKAHHAHAHDDDDDDGSSFAIRGHGRLGQPVLRDVTDIHQAARMAGTRGGGFGDNPVVGAFARSPADLPTTPSTRPTLANRSLTIPASALLELGQPPAQEIAMPAANERSQLDQVLGAATPISITDYSQRRYSGISADDWVKRVIPKLDERGEIVSPTDNNLGVRDLRGTFIDSSEIMAVRQLQGEGSSENIASSSSTVLPNQDSASLVAQYSCHKEASMYPDIQKEEEVVVAPGNGAQRVLQAYVFLLPICIQKSRLANLLSHWCMSTIILIPQAHAFLAVDSIDGKSSSHLMLSMTQVQSEGGDGGDTSEGKAKGVLNNYEPVLRITTANSGTLLIRFTSQARFDGWMGLFSEEDRATLAPRSSSVPSVFVRHRSHSYHSPGSNPKPGDLSPDTHQGQVFAQGTEQGGMEPRGETPQKRRSWGDRFSFSSHQPNWTGKNSAPFSSNRESRTLNSTTEEYLTDNYSVQQQGQFSENEWRLANNPQPSLTGEQLLQNTIPHLINTNNSEQPPSQKLQSYHPHHQVPFTESMDTIQEKETRGQDLKGQFQDAPGDSTSLPYLTAQGASQSLLPTLQNAYPEQQIDSYPTNPILDDDDDEDDDLYDPEFGIGGNGRRRCQPLTKFCSDILSSGGGASSRPISSVMSAISSGSGSSVPVIPSAAVISAAAAAVSAGWSECEALTAAMADPDLLLSKVTFNPRPSPIPSSRRRIGSGVSFSSSFRLSSSSKARPLSSMNESHSPSLPDPRQNSSNSGLTRARTRSTGFLSASLGRQDHIRDPSAAQAGDRRLEGSGHATTRSQSLGDRVLLGSPSVPGDASSSLVGDRLSSHSSPKTASPGTRVASASVKNGGTITTFANWMMSHASEPAISNTHLSPGGGGGVDLVNAASPEDVVAPLSQFPVGEASLAVLESSALVLEPVPDNGSQNAELVLPPSSME